MIIRPRACGALLALALVPAVAGAQTARNPYADLFGRGPSQGSGGELTSVQLRTTAGAQIGQTLQADFDQDNVVPEGLAAGADASVIAQMLRTKVQAIGQARYSYQEFRTAPAYGAPGFDAGGSVNYKATTHVSVQGGAQFVRSPFFRMQWLSPEIFGPSMNASNSAAMLMMSNDSVEATAGAIAQIGRRSSLSVTGFTRETQFENEPQHDFSATGGRGTYKYQLTRSLGVRAGYAREVQRVAPEAHAEVDRYINEVIDAGIDYSKAFSMGRRTTFAFATETSMVRENKGSREFRVNGNVALERRFLRTWIAQLSANRATEFLPGFRGPVFTERGTAGLAGYLNKRLLLNSHADASRGEVGIGDAKQFITYTADTALTFAMTRHFGVFAQYTYYLYEMPPDPLALVTSAGLSRQAVSVGVKTWVSIIDKEKVPRDPR